MHSFPCCLEIYNTIIAFFVLAAFWMGHQEQFANVHHIDNNFLYLNIISLFFVTHVPFSTRFIGDYNADVIATCLFEFNLMILGPFSHSSGCMRPGSTGSSHLTIRNPGSGRG